MDGEPWLAVYSHVPTTPLLSRYTSYQSNQRGKDDDDDDDRRRTGYEPRRPLPLISVTLTWRADLADFFSSRFLGKDIEQLKRRIESLVQSNDDKVTRASHAHSIYVSIR